MIAVRSLYVDAQEGLTDVRTWGETEAQARSRALSWIAEHRSPHTVFKIGIEPPVCTTTSRMYSGVSA